MTPARRRKAPEDAPNLAADRVLQVLSAFLATTDEQGVAEVSRRVGLDKSVVYRILATLTRHGYLEQNPETRKYHVGLTTWELGQRFRAHSWVTDAAVPLLEELLQRLGSTGYVGSLDGAEIVYLATVDGSGPFRVRADVGSRTSALTTSLGRAILAELPDEEVERVLEASGSGERGRLVRELDATHERGYAINRGESRPGVGAVGAAVKDARGRTIGAISVAFPTIAEFESLWEALPPEVMRIADEIPKRLG